MTLCAGTGIGNRGLKAWDGIMAGWWTSGNEAHEPNIPRKPFVDREKEIEQRQMYHDTHFQFGRSMITCPILCLLFGMRKSARLVILCKYYQHEVAVERTNNATPESK
jgi:hypothetical protein